MTDKPNEAGALGAFIVKCGHPFGPDNACAGCLEQALAEIEQWRSGQRRVFWRVRKPDGTRLFTKRADAWSYWAEGFEWTAATKRARTDGDALGVTRITVRPKVKT